MGPHIQPAAFHAVLKSLLNYEEKLLPMENRSVQSNDSVGEVGRKEAANKSLLNFETEIS